jgi:hypothetical protein
MQTLHLIPLSYLIPLPLVAGPDVPFLLPDQCWNADLAQLTWRCFYMSSASQSNFQKSKSRVVVVKYTFTFALKIGIKGTMY